MKLKYLQLATCNLQVVSYLRTFSRVNFFPSFLRNENTTITRVGMRILEIRLRLPINKQFRGQTVFSQVMIIFD